MKMKDFARNFIIQGITSHKYFARNFIIYGIASQKYFTEVLANSNNFFFPKSDSFHKSEGALGKLKNGRIPMLACITH